MCPYAVRYCFEFTLAPAPAGILLAIGLRGHRAGLPHVGGSVCKFDGLFDPLWCFSRLAFFLGVLRGGAHLGLYGSFRNALRGVCGALAVDASLTVLWTVSGVPAGSRSLRVFSAVVHILASLARVVMLFVVFALLLQLIQV